MKLYCGIDLHANNNLVSIIDEADRVVFERRLPNELEVVTRALQPYQAQITATVVESTYNWYWLVDGLMDAGYDVRLANTVAIKQYSGIKHSDDNTDARHLAHLLRLDILPEGHIYPKADRGVRDLLRRRMQLVRQRTMQHLSLQSLIARHTGLRLSSSQIKQLNQDRIDDLLACPEAALAGKVAWVMMQALNEAVDVVETTVLEQVQPNPAYALLTSIPGVGPIIGQTILLETGPIERFADAGHYASYARCVNSQKLSNGKVKGHGNAKNGNKYLGWAFIEAGHYAAIWNPKIKRYYQRKQSKAHIMVAKKALANKLARACFHMLKQNTVFDVDRAFT